MYIKKPTYDAPTFSLASSYTFGEDGGSYTINPTGGKQTYTDTYTSGSHSTGSTTLSGTYSYTTQTAAAGFSRSNNIVSATKNTVTTARGGFVVRVTLSANGKSSYKDMTFSQEAASLEIGGWSIELRYADIPASGGSVSPDLAYIFTYWLAGTEYTVDTGAKVSYDYNNGIVSASNLLMMEKERTLIKTITVTLSYTLNGQTYTGSTKANVYQEANVLTHGYALIGHSANSNHMIYPKLIDGAYHFALTIEYDYDKQTTNWEGERKILTIANTSAYTSGVFTTEDEGLTSTQNYQLSTTATTDSNIRINIQSLMRTGIEFTVYSNYRYPNYITSIPTWEATLIHSSQISVDFSAHFYYVGVRNLDPIEIPSGGGNVLIGVNTNANICGFESQGGAPIMNPFRGNLYNRVVGLPLCQGTVEIDANSGTTAKNFSIRYFLSKDELPYPLIGVNGTDYVEMLQEYTQPSNKERFRIDLDDRTVAGSQFAYFKRIDNQGNFINSAPTSNLTIQGQLQYQTINETSHLQNFSVIWSAGKDSCMIYFDATPQINNINFVGGGFTITPSEDDTYIYTK